MEGDLKSPSSKAVTLIAGENWAPKLISFVTLSPGPLKLRGQVFTLSPLKHREAQVETLQYMLEAIFIFPFHGRDGDDIKVGKKNCGASPATSDQAAHINLVDSIGEQITRVQDRMKLKAMFLITKAAGSWKSALENWPVKVVGLFECDLTW